MSSLGRRRYCVFGCTDLGAYMHGFPHPERRPELFKKWVSIVGNKLKETDPLKIYKNKKICSYHFSWDQKVACHRLKDSAVPSLYLNGCYASPSVAVQMEHNYCIHGVQTSDQIAQTSRSAMSTIETGSSSDKGKQSTSNDATNFELIDQEYSQNRKNDVDKATSDVTGEEYILNETDSRLPGSDDMIEYLEDTEPETVPEGHYTWQRTPLVCTDDVEEVSNDETYAEEPPLITLAGDVEPEYTDYVCNECNCNISGVRYKCVQCSDYDVCADCEARGVHALHYALRVPEHSEQDEVVRVIEAIRKCLNENPSIIMMPEDEGIKEEIKEEINESDVEECDPLRREEQLHAQARDQKDSTYIHIVPASYAEAVSVKTANTILVQPTKHKPLGHAITKPVGLSNSAPVKLISLQEISSKDMGNPKNISSRKNIVLKSNLLLPPIKRTTITCQNVNTMSLSNLRENTVILAKRDAVGNLVVSKVCGKPILTQKSPIIDLEDSNTKKPRYSKVKMNIQVNQQD